VHLAMPNAKLGAKVDRYSFLVRILHSLLHTGLARRTNIPITLIDQIGPFSMSAIGCLQQFCCVDVESSSWLTPWLN
jgi:hypothetical protein